MVECCQTYVLHSLHCTVECPREPAPSISICSRLVCLTTYLFLCLSTSAPVYLSLGLFVCLFVYLSTSASVYLGSGLFVYLFACGPIGLSLLPICVPSCCLCFCSCVFFVCQWVHSTCVLPCCFFFCILDWAVKYWTLFLASLSKSAGRHIHGKLLVWRQAV